MRYFLFVLVFFCQEYIVAQDVLHVDLNTLASKQKEFGEIDTLMVQKGEMYKIKEDSIIQTYTDLQKSLNDRIEKGSITQKEVNDVEARLKLTEEQLVIFRQNAAKGMQLYRQELIQPILDKVYTQIAEVAKARRASIVYDRSTGGIVYLDESLSIDDEVTTKLKQK